MKISLRTLLPLLVPILSIIYAIGDYNGWWDHLSGRSSAINGLSRLASPRGYPEILILDHEKDFKSLLSLIISRTNNKDVINLYKIRVLPQMIVRIGGTLKPDVGSNLPDGWPNPKFAPDSSPVAFIYNYERITKSIKGDNAKPVGNLGDIRRWIEDSKNRERYVVSTILIGVLSIIVVFLDLTRNNKINDS